MNQTSKEPLLFAVGDYVGGAAVGAATALAVRGAVDPETDMVLAMLIGMGVGMVVHLLLALLLTPVIGAFHAMVPGSLIGMYGGMLFAMRDSMQAHAGSLGHAGLVGAAFGIIVIAAVRVYDATVRGSVSANLST